MLATMSSASHFVNIAAYKFVTFNDTLERRADFQAICKELDLKGTILLTPEGINLFLAGTRSGIDSFLVWLRRDARRGVIIGGLCTGAYA